ncbi:MAG: DUF4062 domain-containing protein [Acidobacteria bacterium]|nr:DUF4062 domain-containing protein [Acidobacteriota bacterium]
MPREEKVLIVFVASPSDLESERNRIEEVIRELNVTWSRRFGLRLDLVRWETHGVPGFGEDAQDVLNQELPYDYDIFVGMMWSKYGTPTGRAGSGTEEEFNRALMRFRAAPNTLQIMFYFKDAPLKPSAIDPEELTKSRSFRESLGEEGGLYFNFGSLEEFERLIRLHLSRQIQSFECNEARTRTPALVPTPLPDLRNPEAEEEIGALDLLDIAEEHFLNLTESTKRIANETTALGQNMSERTAEITSVGKPSELSRHELKGLIEKTAVDMNHFVARVRAELPLFRESLGKGSDAFAKVVLIGAEIREIDRTQVEEWKSAMQKFTDELGTAYDSITSFQSTISSIPRMTTVLNRAKRDTTKVLGEVLESITESRRMLLETLRGLDNLRTK